MTTPNHMPQSPPIVVDLVERDDGLFQIGIGDDAAGPFPSRSFAQAVAAQASSGDGRAGHLHVREQRIVPLVRRIRRAYR